MTGRKQQSLSADNRGNPWAGIANQDSLHSDFRIFAVDSYYYIFLTGMKQPVVHISCLLLNDTLSFVNAAATFHQIFTYHNSFR